jgi:hypothetical protein
MLLIGKFALAACQWNNSYLTFHIISYELQIDDSARGKGLGEHMMRLLEKIGMHWKMEKVMLTVFKGEGICMVCRSRQCRMRTHDDYSKHQSLQILYKKARVSQSQ